jgi:hypothetical protein
LRRLTPCITCAGNHQRKKRAQLIPRQVDAVVRRFFYYSCLILPIKPTIPREPKSSQKPKVERNRKAIRSPDSGDRWELVAVKYHIAALTKLGKDSANINKPTTEKAIIWTSFKEALNLLSDSVRIGGQVFYLGILHFVLINLLIEE